MDGAPGTVPSQARMLASQMLAGIGVKLDWRDTCPAQGIRITLTHTTPRTLRPGALAYALPYEGTRIRVFYDRIQEITVMWPRLRPRLLTYVLVHEITHILQGAIVHSDRGVMKACWDQKDYREMMGKGLVFTSKDISLIRSGMSARAAHSDASPVPAMDHHIWDTSIFALRP
jgi:hypothetical protein